MIIIQMKSFNHRYELQSSSTQQREKRFTRKNRLSTSRSQSNYSPTSSISKFFVKHLNQKKISGLQQLIKNKDQKVKPKVQWTPPKRQLTPSKTEFQKKLQLTQQQLLRDRALHIQRLKEQNQKYKKYSKKINAKLGQRRKQITNLEEKLKQLQKSSDLKQKQNHGLKKQIYELQKKLYQKETILQIVQKQHTSLKKVKTSIFQSRMEEYEREKNELNEKVFLLQKTLEGIKSNSFNSSFPSMMSNAQEEEWKNSLLDCLKKSEEQAYSYKQQNNKLQIELNFQKRQFYKEMDIYKQNKDNQYSQLKKKFSQFLLKYKTAMKNMASLKIHNLVKHHKGSKRQKSLESLEFSSAQEEVLGN